MKTSEFTNQPKRSRIGVRDDRRMAWNDRGVAFGFTLAEVLITLGIIGIVAAMTIPQLVNYNQQQEAVVGLKKAYSEISQTLKLAELNNGTLSSWDFFIGKDYYGGECNTDITNFVENYILPYMKTNVICKIYNFNYNTQSCNPINYYIKQNGSIRHSTREGSYSFMSKDNIFYYIFPDTSAGLTNGSMTILVDINGPKKPNIYGKDVFFMKIMAKKGLIMYGYDYSKDGIMNNCNATSRGFCGALVQTEGWQITKNYPWAELK